MGLGGGRDIGWKSLTGTLSLYENAAVLTHQSTVRKDWRFHKACKRFPSNVPAPPIPYAYAASCWVSKRLLDGVVKVLGRR